MTTKELSGIAHELAFWQGFVKTERFLKGWVSNTPTPELNDIVKQFIHYNAPENARIMDVGSGVVSILHGLRHDLNITAMDPLGDLYSLIFNYNRFGLVKPVAIPAEEIDKENVYDIVHCSNALDHTQLPAMAYARMYEAVKPGGWLIIQGFTNEAIHENYAGFHQWNLDMTNEGVITVTGKDGVSVGICLPATQFHRVELAGHAGREWFIWIGEKNCR
jgi:SAM-dependent methyltransferase